MEDITCRIHLHHPVTFRVDLRRFELEFRPPPRRKPMTFKPFCTPSFAALAARAAIESAKLRVSARRAERYAAELEAAAQRIGADLTTAEGYAAAAAFLRRSKQSQRGNATRRERQRFESIKTHPTTKPIQKAA